MSYQNVKISFFNEKSIRVIPMLLLVWGGVTGCSLEASLGPLTEDAPEVFAEKATQGDIVPSSSQGIITAQGYEVQSSLSYYNAKPEVVTSQGYTVQTNIQSSLFKE